MEEEVKLEQKPLSGNKIAAFFKKFTAGGWVCGTALKPVIKNLQI